MLNLSTAYNSSCLFSRVHFGRQFVLSSRRPESFTGDTRFFTFHVFSGASVNALGHVECDDK